MTRYGRTLLLGLLALGALTASRDGQAESAVLELTIPNPAPSIGDLFGYSVAAVGNNLLVSAPSNNIFGIQDAGAVYLLDGTSGATLLTIDNPDPDVQRDDWFGIVSALGTNILVGDPDDDEGGINNVGSVYLFDGITGALLLTIPNPFPEDGDAFGSSVSVIGGNILVGASNDDPGGISNAGSVYLFDGTTGALQLTIPNPSNSTAVGDRFGTSVSEVGGHILVGAQRASPGGVSQTGAAYLFDGNSGALLLTISNPEPEDSDFFGASVASVGENMLVGALLDDPGGITNAGSVYLFDGTTGALLLTVPNPTPAPNKGFGGSVAGVAGDFVVGGGTESPGLVPQTGSVYLFHGASGALLDSIPNPEPGPNDLFGAAVAGVGESILVGAFRDNPGGVSEAGSAYLFCRDLDDDMVCNPEDNCASLANPDQDDADTDGEGDACDTGDSDGDLLSDRVEYFCEAPPDDAFRRPERVDGTFASVDDDGDALIDEALPPGAGGFDCDGDGFTGSREAGTPLCGNGVNDDGFVFGGADDGVVDDGCPGGPPAEGAYSEAQFNIGSNDQDPCGGNGWPSELLSGGITHNKVTLQDVTSFVAPAPRKYQTNPGAPGFNQRWDLVPGRSGATTWIALNDITSLVAGPSGTPPMLGGVKAFGGPVCPWAP